MWAGQECKINTGCAFAFIFVVNQLDARGQWVWALCGKNLTRGCKIHVIFLETGLITTY